MGDDVLYSGTLAAAIEGRNLGHPAIAISMADHEPSHYDAAARIAGMLVARLLEAPLPTDTILNVNVPDRPFEALAGFRATRLGTRHQSRNAIRQMSPRGQEIFWIGAAGEILDDGPGTDFAAVAAGFVSVTPLQIDLTRHDSVDPVGRWLERLA